MLFKNEKGFSLLESLFVLSVFLLILTFSILLLNPHHHLLEKQLFLSQLKSDLLLAQEYALSNQELVTVNFDPGQHYYHMKKTNGKLLVKRFYSEKIAVTGGSLKPYFKFTASGNINSFGSIYIYIEEESYRLTFLIGHGRFYIEKL